MLLRLTTLSSCVETYFSNISGLEYDDPNIGSAPPFLPRPIGWVAHDRSCIKRGSILDMDHAHSSPSEPQLDANAMW